MKHSLSVYQICLIAFAIVLNLVGAQIALLLQLPIYLDSIGTCLVAYALGPIYAVLPGLFSSVINTMLGDAYALYYAPVGILLGFLYGYAWNHFLKGKERLLIAALFISIPTSLLSACITAYLFGGITSSGSTYIVQLLAHTPLGLTISCFIVQFITDYLDRLLALMLVKQFKQRIKISK